MQDFHNNLTLYKCTLQFTNLNALSLLLFSFSGYVMSEENQNHI